MLLPLYILYFYEVWLLTMLHRFILTMDTDLYTTVTEYMNVCRHAIWGLNCTVKWQIKVVEANFERLFGCFIYLFVFVTCSDFHRQDKTFMCVKFSDYVERLNGQHYHPERANLRWRPSKSSPLLPSMDEKNNNCINCYCYLLNFVPPPRPQPDPGLCKKVQNRLTLCYYCTLWPILAYILFQPGTYCISLV